MADLYANYAELSAAKVLGVDYTITAQQEPSSTLASIAIHGGGIEGGSGEMARYVAGIADCSYYEFAGIMAANNTDLHITSTNFDEPQGVALVAASRRTVSFHGFTGTTGVPETWIGGLDIPLRDRIRDALVKAGFSVTVAASEIAGTDPLNICNKNARGQGVQLEMSRSQREAFFPGATTSRAVRDSGQRTSAFYAYATAVLTATAGREPDISLRVALLGPSTVDPFTRTVSSGWGGPWTNSGGSAIDYSVASGTARMSLASANVSRRTYQAGISLADVRRTVIIRAGALAAGAPTQTGPMLRHLDSSNYYVGELQLNTNQTIDLRLRKNVAGTLTTLATVPTSLVHTTTGRYGITVEMVGNQLRARTWDATTGAEGTTWMAQVTDTSLPGAGNPGNRAVAATGATGLPTVVEFDDDTTTPYWTDLTPRILYGDGGGPLTIDIGRQSELQDVEPTRIAAALRNGDGALNPRNPASPYYGTWEQGRQVQVSETVDGEQIDLASGYLEIPDVQVNSPNVDQPCSITAVDRLGRLAGAAPYAGTLAEHVRSQGGNLVLHYPLDDAYPHMSSNTLSTLGRVVTGFDTSVAAEPEDLIQAANLAGPTGDDRSYARWAPVSDGTGFLARARLEAPVNVQVGATDTLAVSLWVHSQPDANNYAYSGGFFNLINAAGVPGIYLNDSSGDDSLRYTWWSATIDSPLLAGRRLGRDAWRLITMRINAATGAMDFWVGADAAASRTAVAPPGATTLTLIQMGMLYVGAMAHVQVRVGPDATTMTRAMHLAQYAHGYRGLQRQTVAERIATLAGYAGVPAGDLELPGEASTPMQRAHLTGTNPASAMQDAATTGQDTLMTTPQGRITLVPRGRRYNQPVTLQIPFGWLSRGGIRYRPDKPVTDTAASIADGGTARRVDEGLRARYGVLGRTVTLDSAVDADAANWASWTLAAFGQPRTRCPLLRINLLDRALADRKALLRLKVGDRIQLTGMPANSPEDVPHLIVQGIRHIIGPHRVRLLELNTSPLLGPTPGTPPACPVVGDLVSNTAIVAY